MGHNLNIHMDYYRLTDVIEQITKVGRLLVAVEDGRFKRGEAIHLNDIDVDQYEIGGTHIAGTNLSEDTAMSPSTPTVDHVDQGPTVDHGSTDDDDWSPPTTNKQKSTRN